LRYFSGAARLMAGKRDGLKRFDLTADGFWNSFGAIPVALPPMALAWIEYERVERASPPADVGTVALYGAHAFADITAWLFPLLVLALAARPLGFSRRLVPLVVTLNWGSALIAWCLAPVWILLLIAGRGEGGSVLGLVLMLASVVLTVRLVAAATDLDHTVSTGIVALTVFCSFLAYVAVADLTGIALV
jgi:hypothetical protein